MAIFTSYILSRTDQVNFYSPSGIDQSLVIAGDTGNAAELQSIRSDVTSTGSDANIIAIALANTNLTADKLANISLRANATATDGTDWAIGLKESYIKSSKTTAGNISITAIGLCENSQDPTVERRNSRRGDPAFGLQDSTIKLGNLDNSITLTSTATAGNWMNEAVAYGINGGSIDAQDSKSSLSSNGESKKYSLICGDGNDFVSISAKASNVGRQYSRATSPFADPGQQRSVGIHNSALDFGNGNNTLQIETGVSLGNAPSSYQKGALLHAKSSSLFDGKPSTSQTTSAGASADLNKSLLQFGNGDDTINIFNGWYSDIYLGKGNDTLNLAAGNELYIHSAGGNSTINFTSSAGSGTKSSISALATSTEVFNRVSTSEGTVYVDKSITINIDGKEEFKRVPKIINLNFSEPKITPGIVVEGQQSFLVIAHDQFTGGEELKLSYSIGSTNDLVLGETEYITDKDLQKGQILVPISATDNTTADGNRDIEFTLTTSINGINKYSTKSKISILDDEPPAAKIPAIDSYIKKITAPNFQKVNFGGDPGGAMSKYYNYVDRYNLTLKDAFITDYRAGRTSSQAVWGESHWFANGINSGRVLEVITGTEDINDYGAYVENYGSTLLDIYRKDPRSVVNGGALSMFNWGKEHFNSLGQTAGRQISGGVDWGAIVKNQYNLYTLWQDAKRLNPSLTAFSWGSANRSQIMNTLGIKVGSDNADILTGNFVYAQNGNDVIGGSKSNDILSGGFGDDIIVGYGGGTDTAYGGPGRDIFHITKDTKLLIRDFRDGADMIQLGNGLKENDVKIVWDGMTGSSNIVYGSDIIANVFGIEPNQLSFAIQSDGVDNVFI